MPNPDSGSGAVESLKGAGGSSLAEVVNWKRGSNLDAPAACASQGAMEFSGVQSSPPQSINGVPIPRKVVCEWAISIVHNMFTVQHLFLINTKCVKATNSDFENSGYVTEGPGTRKKHLKGSNFRIYCK